MQHKHFTVATILALATSIIGAVPAVPVSAASSTVASSVLPALTPIIPSTTIVLQSGTLQDLAPDQRAGQLDLRKDNLQLQFAHLTPDVQGLHPGDVIVSGVTPATPYGLLRRVTAVSQAGAGVQVSTAPATLTDAISQGAFTVQRSLDASTITSFQTLLPGVSRGSSRPQYPFCLSVANVPLVVAGSGALTGTPAQVSGSITASGSICASITFNLSIQIRGVSIEYPTGRVLVQFQTTGAEMTDVRLTGSGALTVQQSYELGAFYLQPLVFSVGPVPVVLTPKVVFTLSANGKVTAGVTAGVTQTDSYQAGLQCTNQTCSAVATMPAPAFTPDPVTISAGTTVTGSATPELDLLLYGLVGPALDVQGYIEADASAHSVNLTAPLLSWVVYAGLQVQIGIALDVVGIYHKDYSQTVYSWRTVIAHSQQRVLTAVVPADVAAQPSVSPTFLLPSPTATPNLPMSTATATPVPTV